MPRSDFGEAGVGGVEHIFLDRPRLGLDHRQHHALLAGDQFGRARCPQHVGEEFPPERRANAEEEAEEHASAHRNQGLLGILGQRRRGARNHPRALGRDAAALDRVRLLVFLQRAVVELAQSIGIAFELAQFAGGFRAAEQPRSTGGKLVFLGLGDLVFVGIGIGDPLFFGLDRVLDRVGLTPDFDGDGMLVADMGLDVRGLCRQLAVLGSEPDQLVVGHRKQFARGGHAAPGVIVQRVGSHQGGDFFAGALPNAIEAAFGFGGRDLGVGEFSVQIGADFSVLSAGTCLEIVRGLEFL